MIRSARGLWETNLPCQLKHGILELSNMETMSQRQSLLLVLAVLVACNSNIKKWSIPMWNFWRFSEACCFTKYYVNVLRVIHWKVPETRKIFLLFRLIAIFPIQPIIQSPDGMVQQKTTNKLFVYKHFTIVDGRWGLLWLMEYTVRAADCNDTNVHSNYQKRNRKFSLENNQRNGKLSSLNVCIMTVRKPTNQ